MLGLEKGEGEEQAKNDVQYMVDQKVAEGGVTTEKRKLKTSGMCRKGTPLNTLVILRHEFSPEHYAITKPHLKTGLNW